MSLVVAGGSEQSTGVNDCEGALGYAEAERTALEAATNANAASLFLWPERATRLAAESGHRPSAPVAEPAPMRPQRSTHN